MTKTLASLLSACALLGGGAAMLGAAAQDRTQYPGQPTQGKVWIQNRGNTEAVPVSIQNVASESPLRVQVTGIPTVTTGSGSVVQARVARQSWEYRNVSITAGQDPVVVLNNAGVEGWETAGLALPSADGIMIVMKRPK
jgi:hypothetical protein